MLARLSKAASLARRSCWIVCPRLCRCVIRSLVSDCIAVCVTSVFVCVRLSVSCVSVNAHLQHRAATACELYSLSREHLQLVLMDFPEFENTLRKVADLRDQQLHDAPSKVKAPPPFGLRSWAEVTETRNFDKFYNSVLGRSRTLQAASYNPTPQTLDVIVPPRLQPLLVRPVPRRRVATCWQLLQLCSLRHGAGSTPDVFMLQVYLTRNAHELWVDDMLSEGWVYDSASDMASKRSPSLVPFDRLPAVQQEHLHRATVVLVKLLLKNHFRITAKADDAWDAVEEWEFGTDDGSDNWTPNPCTLGQDLSIDPELMDIVRVAAEEDHLVRTHDRVVGWRLAPMNLCVCVCVALCVCVAVWLCGCVAG